ncbi:MAG TPA: IPT/TIG domain-containing protein [Kofleriaceae bacterium]|nr:IPT/TIG domain-containing protein [Kofleriaceae bacterium]
MTRLVWLALLVAACGQVSVVPPDAAIDAPTPTFATISPTSGIVTTMVTITGTNFGSTKGIVTIGGIDAMVTSWTDTSIEVAVPNILPQMADVRVMTAFGVGLMGSQQFQVVLPPVVYIHNGASDPTFGSDTITMLQWNPTMMTLTAVTPNIPTGMDPSQFGGCDTSIYIHTASRRLFVTGLQGLAVFDIDPVTGALAPIPGSPFVATGATDLLGIEVNKAATRLWSPSFQSNALIVYDLAADGTATQTTGSPFAISAEPDVAVLSSDETYLYVNTEADVFTGFTTADTTALTGAPYTQGFFSYFMARRPQSEQIFIPGGLGTGELSIWEPDPTTGVPTQASGSPYTLTGITEPNGTAFSPDGNHVYLINFRSATVAEFALSTAGVPSAVAGSPVTVAAGFQGACPAVTADDKFLVVAGLTSVAVMSLAATGAATSVTGSPFAFSASHNTNGIALTF